MLPRLQAEERCQRINDMACGTGNLPSAAAQHHVGMLQRASQGGQRGETAAPANADQLATSGIGLRIVSEPFQAPLNDLSRAENGDV